MIPQGSDKNMEGRCSGAHKQGFGGTPFILPGRYITCLTLVLTLMTYSISILEKQNNKQQQRRMKTDEHLLGVEMEKGLTIKW
jgi:hypothetical protein